MIEISQGLRVSPELCGPRVHQYPFRDREWAGQEGHTLDEYGRAYPRRPQGSAQPLARCEI
jgi:hypothetical protein